MYAQASDLDLLADLVGAELARGLPAPAGVVLEMEDAGLAELGLAAADRRRILACAELARRYQPRDECRRPVTTARQAVAQLTQLRTADREVLAVLLLDAQLHADGVEVIARGGRARVAVGAAEVFRPAVARGASAIIIAHNHPSGSVLPSAEDIEFTRQMVAAGATLQVEVLDHIIVARRSFHSLREAREM